MSPNASWIDGARNKGMSRVPKSRWPHSIATAGLTTKSASANFAIRAANGKIARSLNGRKRRYGFVRMPISMTLS